MAVLCAVSVAVMLVVLLMIGGRNDAAFVPPPFDERAESGVPDVPEKFGWNEIDTGAYKASLCGEIFPEENRIKVWLYNPTENDVWMKLRVINGKGETIGETGLIRPGEYVESIHLTEVPESGSGITLKLMAYEPETYYSAGAVSLNTKVK